MYATWRAPSPSGIVEERALVLGTRRTVRLLLIPPLFAEHNLTRHQWVEVMRRLDRAGIDCVCPDLPGVNDSLAPLSDQTLAGWRSAVETAATHFAATHVLAIRGGTLLLPPALPAFVYAPVKGSRILRAMLRARIVAAQEAGRVERLDELTESGRRDGSTLGGYAIGPAMFAELETAMPSVEHARPIEQVELGGSPLWLRAEPSDDPEQADALAALLAVELTG